MQFKYESNTTQATKFPILYNNRSVYEPLVFSGSNLVYPRSYNLFNAPERNFGSVNAFTDYGSYYWSTQMFNTSRVVTAWNSQGSATFYTSSNNYNMTRTWAKNYYAVIEGSKTSPHEGGGGICWPLKKATSAILANEGKTQDDLTVWTNAIVSFHPTLIDKLPTDRYYYIGELNGPETLQVGIPEQYTSYDYTVNIRLDDGEITVPRKSVCVGIKGGDDVDEPAAGSDVGFIYLSCNNSDKTCKLTMEPYGDIGRFLRQSSNYYTNRSHEIKYLGYKPGTSNIMFGIHSYFPVSSLRRKWSNGSTTPKDVIGITPPLYSVTTDYHARTEGTSAQFYYNITGSITWSALGRWSTVASASGTSTIPSNNPLLVGDSRIYTNVDCTNQYSRPHWYLEDCNWGLTW